MPLPARSARPQILIIEDEPAIAGSMASFLRLRGGFEAVIAPDAMVAQGLLGAQRWDAVILDQLLGRGPRGDMVLRAAARRDPALPDRTIFMTGDISEATAEIIAACGCYHSLEKPFSLTLLLDLVREIVDRDRSAAVAEGRRQA